MSNLRPHWDHQPVGQGCARCGESPEHGSPYTANGGRVEKFALRNGMDENSSTFRTFSSCAQFFFIRLFIFIFIFIFLFVNTSLEFLLNIYSYHIFQFVFNSFTDCSDLLLLFELINNKVMYSK